MSSVNMDLYVLDSVFDGNRIICVCNFPTFSPLSEIYWTSEIPLEFDVSEITLFVRDHIDQIITDDDINEVPNFTIHYVAECDLIEVEDNKIVDRDYNVYPVYIDDCTLSGDAISETDSVQLLVQHPNGQYNIVQTDNESNYENICNKLITNKEVDKNCNINFYDYDKECSEPFSNFNKYTVNDGKLIIPATIK